MQRRFISRKLLCSPHRSGAISNNHTDKQRHAYRGYAEMLFSDLFQLYGMGISPAIRRVQLHPVYAK